MKKNILMAVVMTSLVSLNASDRTDATSTTSDNTSVFEGGSSIGSSSIQSSRETVAITVSQVAGVANNSVSSRDCSSNLFGTQVSNAIGQGMGGTAAWITGNFAIQFIKDKTNVVINPGTGFAGLAGLGAFLLFKPEKGYSYPWALGGVAAGLVAGKAAQRVFKEATVETVSQVALLGMAAYSIHKGFKAFSDYFYSNN